MYVYFKNSMKYALSFLNMRMHISGSLMALASELSDRYLGENLNHFSSSISIYFSVDNCRISQARKDIKEEECYFCYF